jgi:hypothetical protein
MQPIRSRLEQHRDPPGALGSIATENLAAYPEFREGEGWLPNCTAEGCEGVCGWCTDKPLRQIVVPCSQHFADVKLPETFGQAVPSSFPATRSGRRQSNATVRNATVSIRRRVHTSESEGRKQSGIEVTGHSSFEIAARTVSCAKFQSTTEFADWVR